MRDTVGCVRTQLETLVSLLITERLSLERAVVAASKARSAAAATTPPSQIESATVAGGGSGASVDMDKQLELMTKRYESQIHAIRTQVRVTSTLQQPVLR